jgi:hypothetical protein
MSTKEQKNKRKNILIYNLIFLAVCTGLFLFLWNAPEETTKHLPNDEDHIKFLEMDKKEAEKFCEECHSPDGIAPLPEDHPPKYRCLFCHKRNQ